MSLSKISTGRGRQAQLKPGVGNNQFARASEFNPVVDLLNGLMGSNASTASASSTPTINAASGYFTTGTLSAAAGAASTITLTNFTIQSTSHVLVILGTYSGTLSTNGIPVLLEVTPGAGTCTIKIANVDAANALSGTLVIRFIVL